MTLYLEREETEPLPFDPQQLARQVADAVLDAEAFPYASEVSLLLTGEEEIREINASQRGIDAATDVLSFPMLDCAGPWIDSPLPEDVLPVNPDTGAVMLGDIVISTPRIFAQAEEYGHSVRREFAFLIAHSMLHLLGYDHMEEDERARMEERQRDILDGMGIGRSEGGNP